MSIRLSVAIQVFLLTMGIQAFGLAVIQSFL